MVTKHKRHQANMDPRYSYPTYTQYSNPHFSQYQPQPQPQHLPPTGPEQCEYKKRTIISTPSPQNTMGNDLAIYAAGTTILLSIFLLTYLSYEYGVYDVFEWFVLITICAIQLALILAMPAPLAPTSYTKHTYQCNTAPQQTNHYNNTPIGPVFKQQQY